MISKIIRHLEHLTEHRCFPLVFLPIAFLLLLFASSSTSPLYVTEGFDSTVFKTMGLIILQGKTPYVDYFDHKGPVLYFINALGQWLHEGRIGLFALQVLNLWGVCVFLFKTACLIVRRTTACIVLCLALASYLIFVCDGNLTQEWVLLPLSITMFLTIRFLTFQYGTPFPLMYAFLFGLCFGYAFYIQPNDAVAHIGGLTAGVGLYLLYNKRYGELLRLMAGFLGAFMVVTMPLFWYFASRHAVTDWYYGMITFNKLYAGGLATLIKCILSKYKLVCVFLYAATMVLAWQNGYKSLLWAFIPQMILASIFLGTRGYYPYYLIFVPVILCFACFFFQKKYILATGTIGFIILLSINYHSFEVFIKDKILYRLDYNRINRVFYAETDRLLDFVPAGEQHQIWNYNLFHQNVNGIYRPDLNILLHKGLIQCNKVAHPLMLAIDGQLRIKDNVQASRPPWILLSHGNDDAILDSLPLLDSLPFMCDDYAFIEANYTLVARTDTTICDIMLYRRND